MGQRQSSSLQQVIVVSNREPYQHARDAEGRLSVRRSSSGVVNAVEPLLLVNAGVWIAEGRGAADRAAARDRDGVSVPVGLPRYRLRRVWIPKGERRGYYYGFANSGLWPLCHRTMIEPVFFATDFQVYERVNRRFADVVSEEAVGASPIVLVQDYHFALAPLFIRRQLPLSRVATFWHIPWPRCETFEMCPWSRTLLEGLLGSSLIGFQTSADRCNFLRTVGRLLQVDVYDGENVLVYKGRRVKVGVYPASIEWPASCERVVAAAGECRVMVNKDLHLDGDVRLGVGVDRLDYTKGLEQKFLSVERLLERRPDLVGRFVFVQLAEPSRDCLPAYRHTRTRVLETAARINQRFAGTHSGPEPIIVIEGHHATETVFRFLRAADVCYVGSLHDGMNLVSKEFVSARDDEQGVLVLSAFAGAAHELTDALIVNPYDLDGVARALADALTMESLEQRDRMRGMRRVVANADAQHWANRIVADVLDHEVLRIAGTAGPLEHVSCALPG